MFKTRLHATMGASTPRGESLLRMTVSPASAAARDTARHFANSVEEVSEYSSRDLDPNGMVSISIHNAGNRTSLRGVFHEELSDFAGCLVERL